MKRIMKGAQAALLLAGVFALPSPLFAKDSLGIFGDWGAFADPQMPRCYAIAKAAPSRLQRDFEPYASIGTWPTRDVRGQLHFRLSRKMATDRLITLRIGDQSFKLTGTNGDAWAPNQGMDAAIVAAMRAAGSMIVGATDQRGRRFSNTYNLDGVATAMDAATVGCANL